MTAMPTDEQSKLASAVARNMSPKDDQVGVPWFRRVREDGKPEPMVSRGDKGEIVIVDADGWAASYKDGRWRYDMLFHSRQMAEFTAVVDRDEIYRLYEEARAAVGTEIR